MLAKALLVAATQCPISSRIVDANISLDQELDALQSEKAEFVHGLPLLHTESIEPSIQQFCDIARVRLERCVTFDDKRQFLTDYVERVIYDRYRVTVIGSVPIKMQFGNSQEIETRKIAFCLRGEIDKTTLHKTKPRKKFAEDGRMDTFGAGGRKAPSNALLLAVSPFP